MGESIVGLLPLAGVAFVLWIGWGMFKRHSATTAGKSSMNLVAFCTPCGWEGNVKRTRMICPRCSSTRLSVTAT